MRKKLQGMQNSLSYFFICLSFLLNLINKRFLNAAIPKEMLDYLFWFGFGFFMNYIIFGSRAKQ